MDKWTDSFPVRLFLPVLDEHYCRIHFPNVHARRQREHWVRPERNLSMSLRHRVGGVY
jgi:hypothetical protein